MRIGSWEIKRQPRGFNLKWIAPDGRTVQSFPRVKVNRPRLRPWNYWVFYPYVFAASLRAVLQNRSILLAWMDSPRPSAILLDESVTDGAERARRGMLPPPGELPW